MKRLLIFFLLTSPACAQSNAVNFYAWLMAQTTHTFPALDTNNAFTGPNTFTGKFSVSAASNINNMMYVSQQCGGSTDLGVCIANAATNSPVNPPYIFVDSLSPTTLSTAPNLPMGTTIYWTPAIYTFAATFPIQHRGVQWLGNGAQFNYNQDAGGVAILVGKNLSGTLNCNGTTTLTQASGSLFTQFDPGDKIFVGNSGFNVASVTDSSHLVVTSTCSLGAAQSFNGFMATSSALGAFTSNVHLRDFVVNYTGAGTNAADGGIEYLLLDKPYVENVGAINFTNGKGIQVLGVQGGQFHNNKTDNDAKGLTLDDAAAGTALISANINMFFNFRQIVCTTAAGYAILIQGHAFANEVKDGGDIEGCAATQSVQIAGSAYNNWIGPANDFENNGDSTTNARDIKVTAVPAASQPGQHIIGNRFTQRPSSPPGNTGIDCNTASALCYLEENQWQSGDGYTNAWTVGPNGNGFIKNNYPQSFAHTDPGFYVLDQAGNEKLSGNFVAAGVVLSVGSMLANQGPTQTNGNIVVGTGWGTGASAAVCATPPPGQSQSECFTITSGSASFSAAPTVTITFPVALQSNTTPCTLDVIDITGAGGAIMWKETTNSAIAPVFTAKTNTGAAFTPAVTETYTMILRCGP